MKILLFSYYFYPDIGGIESVSKMLAGYFTESGHEVHVITTTNSKGGEDFPYKIIRKPFITTIIKEIKWADLVFENNPCFSLSYPNFFIRRPSIVVLQTWLLSLTGKKRLRDKLKELLLRQATRVVSCSESLRESFPAAITVNNPYDNKLFTRNEQVQKDKDFIFLGRLVSDKGVALAIKAFAGIPAGYPGSTLTIVGDGEERLALEKLNRGLGLEEKVFFKGSLEGKELVDCLNEHKYLLVPSVWKEPFGIVALEGIACGCVPVVSGDSGLPEAVGKAGLVFERGNLDSLTAHMLMLLKDNVLTTGLLKEADCQLKKCSLPVIAEKYLEIMETIIQ